MKKSDIKTFLLSIGSILDITGNSMPYRKRQRKPKEVIRESFKRVGDNMRRVMRDFDKINNINENDKSLY